MAGEPIIAATWATQERADGFYVIERIGDAGCYVEYGPMPESFVQPLIAERSDIVEKACLRHLAQ